MGRRNQISAEEIQARLIPFLTAREEILLAYLFGSLIHGGSRPPGDLDLAVLVDPRQFPLLDRSAPYGYQAELTAAVMEELKFNRIDLTLLHQATPLLAYQIIHTGKLFFSRSDEVRRDFEIAALKRHADTRHLRRIKQAYSEKRIVQGLSAYD